MYVYIKREMYIHIFFLGGEYINNLQGQRNQEGSSDSTFSLCKWAWRPGGKPLRDRKQPTINDTREFRRCRTNFHVVSQIKTRFPQQSKTDYNHNLERARNGRAQPTKSKRIQTWSTCNDWEDGIPTGRVQREEVTRIQPQSTQGSSWVAANMLNTNEREIAIQTEMKWKMMQCRLSK